MTTTNTAGGRAAGTREDGRDWGKTLYLPRTDFPMKAGLPELEPKLLEHWDKTKLYDRLREAGNGKRKFVLHDGPPYANGNIHIGHALNKILKDLVTKSQTMLGYDSNYVPGWDCHGLPIEWQIEQAYRQKGKSKDEVPVNEFRKECRQFAEHWLEVQREEFKRLGVIGDWDHPYTTMTFPAEAQIATECMKFAMNGLLYRGSKPVMWSVVEKTALAEAEVEYHDHQSDMVWVKFPVLGNFETGEHPHFRAQGQQGWNPTTWGDVSIVIWTTTPWTIPGNRAVSYSSKLTYQLISVGDPIPQPPNVEEVATSLEMTVASYEAYREAINQARSKIREQFGEVRWLISANETLYSDFRAALAKYLKLPELAASVFDAAPVPGYLLRDRVCAHPLRGHGYDFDVPLLDGDHVTDDTGTGFVHTAPGHGTDDFNIWMEYGRQLAERGIDTTIPFTVDADGVMTREAPGFEGCRVLKPNGDKGDANDAVIKALVAANALVARGRLKHQYPHSWRSKKPVIFRNTPQWFIAMDKPLLAASDPGTGPGQASRSASRPEAAFPLPSPGAVASPPPGGEGSGVGGNAIGGRGSSRSRQRSAETAPPPALRATSPARGEEKRGAREHAPLAAGSPQGSRQRPGKNPTLRQIAFRAIAKTEWVPEVGRNRITGMIEAKPDWVVSRQRAWGVPITVFVHKETGGVIPGPPASGLAPEQAKQKLENSDELIGRIRKAMLAKGADGWFEDGAAAQFLDGLVDDPAQWEQVTDILDVWFDSGSTHAYTLEDPEHFPGLAGIRRKVDGGKDRVMYLEGSDQHRGWFQSSLLESCGTRGRAPFDVVLTHGFILDEKGEDKMSKSKGNVLSPQDVMRTSGADILRLWVASADTTNDIRFGPGIVQAASESYRKLRNTLRWMLGALAHYRPGDKVRLKDMPELERLMLHRLVELDREIRTAYKEYDYRKVVAVLSQFMNSDLSAFYFDIRKDALYCDAPSSVTRKAALTVIDELIRATTIWLAPILSFTAEEAWMSRHADDPQASVHLQTFPRFSPSWRNKALAEKWDKVRRVRRVVTGALELERAAKRLGSSLEAAPTVYIADRDLLAALEGVDFAQVCITSTIEIVPGKAPDGAFVLPDVAGVAVVPARASGRKCARSWRYTDDVGSDPAYPELSARDAAAMREIDGLGAA